jgi:hypothetical protein
MASIPLSVIEEKRSALRVRITDIDARITALANERRECETRLSVYDELVDAAVADAAPVPQVMHTTPPDDPRPRVGRPPKSEEELEQQRAVLVGIMRGLPNCAGTPKVLEEAVLALNAACYGSADKVYGRIRNVLYRYLGTYFEQGGRAEGWSLIDAHRAQGARAEGSVDEVPS